MPDEPKEFNKGWWFPSGLIRLYEDGVLNGEQIILLGKIHALSHPKKGCYASNEWLGKWWGKHPVWVSRTLKQFKDLGLLKVTLSGKKGRTLRSIKVTYDFENPTTGLTKSLTHPLKEKFKDRVKEKFNPYHTSYDKQNNNCGGKGSRCSPKLPSTPCFFSCGDEIPPFFHKAVSLLEDFIRKKHHLNNKRFNRKLWYDSIRLLLHDIGGDKKRLKRVLTVYTNQPHNEFTPRADSASSFREKFLRIEQWCEKVAPKEVASQIIVTTKRANQDEIDEIPE